MKHEIQAQPTDHVRVNCALSTLPPISAWVPRSMTVPCPAPSTTRMISEGADDNNPVGTPYSGSWVPERKIISIVSVHATLVLNLTFVV